MKTPTPSPEQALHLLEILSRWTARDWWYEGAQDTLLPTNKPFVIYYSNPDEPDADAPNGVLHSHGIDHVDALCQATTVMQVLLEEHPGEP